MANLVRVFRAKTKPGKEEEFRAFFLNEALPRVRSCRGLISAVVGLPHPQTPQSFLMISTWSSVDALKEFAGEDWAEAVIDPREADLLSEADVAHYWDSGI